MMAVIGIDSHKGTLAACLADGAECAVEHRSSDNTVEGCSMLVAWPQTADAERVGIEGVGQLRPARGFGADQSEPRRCRGVPQMTGAARKVQRTGTKSDPVDAFLVAPIAGRDENLHSTVRYRRELVETLNRNISDPHLRHLPNHPRIDIGPQLLGADDNCTGTESLSPTSMAGHPGVTPYLPSASSSVHPGCSPSIMARSGSRNFPNTMTSLIPLSSFQVDILFWHFRVSSDSGPNEDIGNPRETPRRSARRFNHLCNFEAIDLLTTRPLTRQSRVYVLAILLGLKFYD